METSPPPGALGYIPPPLVTSAALQPTVEQAQVDFYLQAIEAEQQRQRAEAALASAYAQQTATAQALQVTATARAWQTTVEAAYVQGTATAQVEQARATATAVAVQTTATAETARFWHSATATAAAWSIQATATANAVHAISTIQAAEAAQAELEARRAAAVAPLRAYGPWFAFFASFGLLLWLGYRWGRAWTKYQSIARDARGDAPMLLFNQPNGDVVILDPDRSFGPATIVGAAVTQPTLVNADYQAQVTARDQAVDLVHRGLPQPARPAQSRRPTPTQAAQLLTQSPTPHNGSVRLVPPAQVRDWLREVRPQVLREALTLEGEVITDNGTSNL